ncbi:YggU family protein [Proteobacteria bacterium 005FR1]|nr:YggU family protein [Proteobacteria bacterium 005FR1]
MASHYRWTGDKLLLFCHVQPGAKRTEVAGTHGERLKIRLAAPPVDGKANTALIDYLAEVFAVSKSEVSIERGLASRQKTVQIVQPGRLAAGFEIDDQDGIPK